MTVIVDWCQTTDFGENQPWHGYWAHLERFYETPRKTLTGWVDRWKADVTVMDRRAYNHRERLYTTEHRQAIQQCVRDNPWWTWAEVQAWFIAAFGQEHVIHVTTLSDICAEAGLYRRVARVKVRLTDAHRQARLNFARERAHWTVDMWRRCIFSDEKGVCGDGIMRRLVTRPNGEADEPEYVQHWPRSTVRVNYFGFVTGSQLGDIHLFPGGGNGAAVAQAVEDSFARIVELGRQNDNPPQPVAIKWIFHDGPHFYTQQPVQQRLEALTVGNVDFRFVTLPPYSPDINIIEHVWAAQERKLQPQIHRMFEEQGTRPRDDQLRPLILHSWEEMRVEGAILMDSLVESLPRRMDAIIAAGGDHTRF